jgi:hypothetical protein
MVTPLERAFLGTGAVPQRACIEPARRAGAVAPLIEEMAADVE